MKPKRRSNPFYLRLKVFAVLLLGAGFVCTTIKLPHYALAYAALSLAAAVLAMGSDGE